MAHLIIDIATAPLPDVAQYLNDQISAPANYKDPAKIDAYIAEKRAEQSDRAALDPDLCRISMVGIMTGYRLAVGPILNPCRSEAEERKVLSELGAMLSGDVVIITFNGLKFDLPILMRRAQYLGVKFPKLNLDRYRSPHIDLFNVLSMNGQLPGHSLQFYKARLGWLDVEKPLQGAEEARVFETDAWEELVVSVSHDLEITKRLAEWCGVL